MKPLFSCAHVASWTIGSLPSTRKGGTSLRRASSSRQVHSSRRMACARRLFSECQPFTRHWRSGSMVTRLAVSMVAISSSHISECHSRRPAASSSSRSLSATVSR